MLAKIMQTHGGLVRSYTSTLSGSAGRLLISLIYFISLANSLSISDFGLFATASAVGVVLSRIVSFGFVSPLYRIATVKHRILGTYYAGYLAAAFVSLPVLALAASGVFTFFFKGLINAAAFTAIIIAEAILWRGLEVVAIVNNGLNRFGRAAILVIAGTLSRAVFAFGFSQTTNHSLDRWSLCYLAANGLAFALALAFYLPRRHLRFRAKLYWRRLKDSMWTSGAEILFYVQMELDKLAVLSIGGAELAGLYAIVMRLADLTAVPIRSFNMLLVQKLMRMPQSLKSLAARLGIEGLIFAISALGLAALSALLWFYPNALGRNVSAISGLLALSIAVPGFRNIVEYHAELLYARGQTGVRMLNLGLLAALKMLLLGFVLSSAPQTRTWLLQMNGVFAVLWLCSAVLTYSAMRMAPRRI